MHGAGCKCSSLHEGLPATFNSRIFTVEYSDHLTTFLDDCYSSVCAATDPPASDYPLLLLPVGFALIVAYVLHQCQKPRSGRCFHHFHSQQWDGT